MLKICWKQNTNFWFNKDGIVCKKMVCKKLVGNRIEKTQTIKKINESNKLFSPINIRYQKNIFNCKSAQLSG